MSTTQLQTNDNTDINPRTAFIFLSMLVFCAFLIRFNGLGERPIARDEYYFVQSVLNILENGLPKWETGGYYYRGLVSQYSTAVSILFFGDTEFAYRLPSAIFGVGTVWMSYMLGRLFLSRSTSLVLSSILTFSSWQIEFSRFARMYSSFQFFSVCFFWAFYKFSFNYQYKKKYLAVLLAGVAILEHQIGILLSAFTFIPILTWPFSNLSKEIKSYGPYFIACLAVLAVGYFQISFNFRTFGVTNRLPLDFIASSSNSGSSSVFGVLVFGEFLFYLLASAISIFMIVIFTHQNIRSPHAFKSEKFYLAFFLVISACSAVFHQFAISGILLLIIALRDHKILITKPQVFYLAVAAGFTLFWLLSLLIHNISPGSIIYDIDIRNFIRSIRLSFFSFPDLYLPVLRVFSREMPILGLFILVSIIAQVFFIRHQPINSILKNPVILILLFILIFGLRPTYIQRTRFSYFIFPLAICLGIMSLYRISYYFNSLKKKGFTFNLSYFTSIIIICIFISSGDFDLHHVFDPTADDISYRTGKYESYKHHWYHRYDFRGAATALNSTDIEDCKIIVSFTTNTVSFYLKKPHAIFWPRKSSNFRGISRNNGLTELWSNMRLLSTTEELEDFIRDEKSVCLVVLANRDPLSLWLEEIGPERIENVETITAGRDNRINIIKAELKTN